MDQSNLKVNYDFGLKIKIVVLIHFISQLIIFIQKPRYIGLKAMGKAVGLNKCRFFYSLSIQHLHNITLQHNTQIWVKNTFPVV